MGRKYDLTEGVIDDGHTQRCNYDLEYARTQEQLDADHVRDPELREGVSFTEHLETDNYLTFTY